MNNQMQPPPPPPLNTIELIVIVAMTFVGVWVILNIAAIFAEH